MDTLAVNAVASPEFNLMALVPYLSPFGLVVVILAFKFSDEIKAFLRRDLVVSQRLREHIDKDGERFDNVEADIKMMQTQIRTMELQNVEIKAEMAKNHEEMIGLVNVTNAGLVAQGKQLASMNQSLQLLIQSHIKAG